MSERRCRVRGRTLVAELPPVTISVAEGYKHVGGQRWNLYELADAEQHLFAKAAGGVAERLYWIQVEEFLPDNAHTYDYPPTHTVDIGGLEFIHDTRAYAVFAHANREPESDGAHARKLLAGAGLELPAAAMRTRLIHLPTADRRSELMIIYARAAEVGADADVDEESPEAARVMLAEALGGIRVMRR